jgi:DNA-binding MarR family transcriptional regulator
MGNDYAVLSPLLMHTITALARRLRVRFAEARVHLTPEQYALLHLLAREEGLTLSELAERLDKDKSAVLRQADHFEQEGLVTRVSDAEDRRKKGLVLSPRGHQLYAQAEALAAALMRDSMQAFSAQDVRTFQRLLTQMADSLQAGPDGPAEDGAGAVKRTGDTS